MEDRKPTVVAKETVQRPASKTQTKPALVSLGQTSQHLQGADGNYSDNDQLRSYHK